MDEAPTVSLAVAPVTDQVDVQRFKLKERPFVWPYVQREFDIPDEVRDKLQTGEFVLNGVVIG